MSKVMNVIGPLLVVLGFSALAIVMICITTPKERAIRLAPHTCWPYQVKDTYEDQGLWYAVCASPTAHAEVREIYP